MEHPFLVPVIVGVLSGVAGGAIQAVVSWRLAGKTFKLNRKGDVYGFFVFAASGLLKSRTTETYDFERMTNEGIAKVALYGSVEVLRCLSQFTKVKSLNSDDGDQRLLDLIVAMRDDLDTTNDLQTAAALSSIKLRRE